MKMVLIFLRFESGFLLFRHLIGYFVQFISNSFHFQVGEIILFLEGEGGLRQFCSQFDLTTVLFLLFPFWFCAYGFARFCQELFNGFLTLSFTFFLFRIFFILVKIFINGTA